MNLESIKADFPIFTHYPELIYLDSAATSLKPQSVIDALTDYYNKYSANISRGVYKISEQATEAYELARQTIAGFVGAQPAEIIFVRNTTEAINLVTFSWAWQNLQAADEILLTHMEHHANIVPWQQLKKHKNIQLKYLPIDDQGLLQLDKLEQLISPQTKVVSLTHVSNVLGTINPIKEIIQKIKLLNSNTLILVDGAQAVPHLPINVRDLNCDFYTFSGHKMLGPTGIGVLYVRQNLLEQLEPFLTGGAMIETVTWDASTFKSAPQKFEAGTPHIAGVIGLGAAVEYLQSIGMENIQSHEQQLLQYAVPLFAQSPEIKILGPQSAEHRSGVISFTIEGIHPHDIAQVLDTDNICVRAGHHCAMPLHKLFGITGSTRASFYLYNSVADIDALIDGLHNAIRKFKG